MSGVFLDSNVLLYLFERDASDKRERALEIVDEAILSKTGVISFQVVQECLNVITHRAKLKAGPVEAREFFDDVLLQLWRVHPTTTLYRRALEHQERYQYSFYDSLIIAAAMEAECEVILSEDMQHGQQIDGVRITNPFLEL